MTRVANELSVTKQFIQSLPTGSRAMTGYLTVGSLQVAQPFTDDLSRAAQSLRITRRASEAVPYNPYIELVDALKKFDGLPAARNLVLLISDGLDVLHGFREASPWVSMDLQRAIDQAQQRGIAVFTFYAPTVGLTSQNHLAINYGQGSLSRLADETGGEAFFQGFDFVTFDPHFRELKALLEHQWLITYRSELSEKGRRVIRVRTDFPEVHLYYRIGYTVK